MRNVHTSLQPARALPVQALDSRADGEPSRESSGTELGGSTAGRENTANCDIFDDGRVDFGTLEESFEGAYEQVGGVCVFEAAFAAFCEGSA